jgi:hypothetical protein
MSYPEQEPCRSCDGTRVLKVIRDGFTVVEDCPRCRESGGLEPAPREAELEAAGQLSILGGD